MRKILAVGILALGSLLSVQVYAQASVSAPILEALQIKGAAAEEIVAAEQKIRDLRMLALEAEQLQIAVKNAKRASPKLWDSSLNIFENLANTMDQADSLYNAASDVGGVMQRAGCFNGFVQGRTGGLTGKTLTQSPVLDFYATPKPEEMIAIRKRNELEGRCMRLAAGIKVKKEVAEAADDAKNKLAGQKEDDKAGTQVTLEYLLDAMNKANIQAMQARLDADYAREADARRAEDILEQQQAMHERLMKSPSSAKKIKPRDPALTVDPRNY
jgi:hypothetical protein